MEKKERTVRYTADEIKGMLARGEDQSDWVAAAAMTDDELHASIVADPEEADLEFDWSKASAVMPEPKAVLHMRVDREVMDFFRKQGKGYQTKINSVLVSYVQAHSRQK